MLVRHRAYVDKHPGVSPSSLDLGAALSGLNGTSLSTVARSHGIAT